MEANALLPHLSRFWPRRAWLWVVPSPNYLHQHLQPFTLWSAEDLGAGCCPVWATVAWELTAIRFLVCFHAGLGTSTHGKR